jgi:hypothetical protein
MFEAPKVSVPGATLMDTNSCGSPQLETLSSTIAAMIRAATLNHFRLINGS